ncbi:MAG: hypothetical protein JRJ87_17980 [Deltaproteobacteria bacterium]|nr:hypothetical protein [Deltaproteobacteria bacterium]
MCKSTAQVIRVGLVAGCLVALVSGCLPRRIGRPAWVVVRQHNEFPAERFIIGVGQGSSRRQAELKALEDAGRLIDSSYTGQDPIVPTVVLNWSSSDGSRHAALATIDRLVFAQDAAKLIYQAEKECLMHVLQAEKVLAAERNLYLGLREYLSALQARARAENQRAFILSIVKEQSKKISGPSISELLQKIDKLLSTVEILVVRGDSQRANASGDLPAALVAGAYLVNGPERFPIKDLPLEFLPPGAKESPAIFATTTEVGTATIQIKGLPVLDKDKSIISVGLNGAKILAAAGVKSDDSRFADLLARINHHKTAFHYFSPGQATIRVAVIIEETTFGRPVARSQVAKYINRALAEKGFDLVDPNTLSDDLALIETLDEAPEAVKDHADVLVYGNVDADLFKVVNETFLFCQTSGHLRAVQLDSSRLLFAFEKTVKGAGLDEFAACQRAKDSFSNKFIPELVETISKLAQKTK